MSVYRYLIEKRLLDEAWLPVEGEQYRNKDAAIARAKAMAQKPIFYGMTRVVDMHLKEVIITFSAGGEVAGPQPATARDIDLTCERATMQVSLMPKWKQAALGGPIYEHHISPNGHPIGSLKHAAEAWLLNEGLIIPDQDKHPLIYEAVLNEFVQTLAFAKWEAGE